MTGSDLRLSDFSICWLRAYDFGLEQAALEQAVVHLKTCPLVIDLRHVANANEIDEVDGRMFDVRYQDRSNLVRVRFLPAELIAQKLGGVRERSATIRVSLLLDLASGFGVFNLCLPQAQTVEGYTIEELVFLMRQWLLAQDDQKQYQRLNLRFPSYDQVVPQEKDLYIREVMNFYYLQTHKVLWEAAKPERQSPLQGFVNFQDWLEACRETDPTGCQCLRELKEAHLIRSLFPTSFGPVLDIWGMEGISPDHFDADAFSTKYAQEISLLFTDGQRTNLGESLHNERQTKSLAMFLWPNHAIHINQNRKSLAEGHVSQRVADYGCLDVEVVRILEILNLQSALLHAFDRQLDQQLEDISSLTAEDQSAVIRATEQRRSIARSMRSFDFFNLFHTAYWEPLYARLLESPRLRLYETTNLVEMKSKRLDEEIQQAVIIQNRIRQQQEQGQELDVLRGLHSLSLANDIQGNALRIINFVVAATASFGFIEVLTRVSVVTPSFPQAYPFEWIGLNVGFFLLVAFILDRVGKSLIRSKSQIIELDGQLDSPFETTRPYAYLTQRRGLEYFHLDIDEQAGYLRIQRPYGTLFLEFDRQRYNRYILFLQGRRWSKPENLRNFVEDEIHLLRKKKIIP